MAVEKTINSSAPFAERMALRARVVTTIRRFFQEQHFIEVDTPVALHAPAPEPHIEALATQVKTLDGSLTRYLQTSPELGMKELLARGLERIFQIAPVFRDGDDSPSHCPEFRLLEWYRKGSSWLDMVDDTQKLVRRCAQDGLGTSHTQVGDTLVDLDAPWRKLSVEEAFMEHTGLSILSLLDPGELREALTKLGIRYAEDDSWDDLFHRVFLERVEPKLLEDPTPLILHSYPAPLASLARLSPTDSRVGERFEVFVGPLELCNGFGELTCPNEQRRRFEHDKELRRTQNRHDYPLPERFLESLGSIESASGNALGLERLLMVLMGTSELSDTLWLPWKET